MVAYLKCIIYLGRVGLVPGGPDRVVRSVLLVRVKPLHQPKVYVIITMPALGWRESAHHHQTASSKM